MISNLPDISKAFGEEKTNEQILDSLQKYRKELNFLLMNLNESNMPEVANRLEGLDGSFSQISQDVDQISLTVYDPNSGIAALNVTAGEISSTVASLDGDFSALSQTVDGISTTVYDSVNGLGAAWSQIDQNANEITSIVSFTDIDGNAIASKINQTTTTITIAASKIDLTGITTIYDADPLYAEFKVQANGRGLNFIDHLGGSYATISYDGFGGAMIYSQAVLQVGDPSSTVSFRGGISFENASSIKWGAYEPIAKFA